MKKDTEFIIKKIIPVITALIGIIPSFVVGQNIGYSEGFEDGQITIQEETIEKLEGVKNIEGENINVYYNATLNNVMSESEDYKSLTSKLEVEKRVLEETVSALQSERSELEKQLSSLSEENSKLKQQSSVSEPLPEPTLQPLTPLSSATLAKTVDTHGYIVNSDFSTLQGSGFEKGFTAAAGGISYDNTISVCGYTPFEIIYNLEKKYHELSGKICFDDISPTSGGFGSGFNGEAQVLLTADNGEKKEYTLTTTDFPIDFSINVQDAEKFSISISFPYSNNVFNNFNKYFDILDAFLDV